ncbi:MAG: glycoside hydrolase family protein [Brevundimonas sp.]|uniref:lysozyme n=1 Tax=Brevundimonas sp. TaxID=1871086 RepID=UPI0024880684|nr:lysozyme [Brevundimonas sp.]MDI1325405.1 glycoside hydrolase family protein [Brevundimonas sp.]
MSDATTPRLKVSREGVVLIKSFEGFRPHAVRGGDGRWIIGYGHTASAREGLGVGEQDAELLLQYDLLPVVRALNERAPASLNQHQFDALASFAISVGVERFLASDVLQRLNEGQAGQAADALIGWPEAASPESRLRRRAAERALFVADPASAVTLADLLAAPLPPPPVESARPQAEAPDARAAAVAALLGETAGPEATPAADPEPSPGTEPVPAASAQPVAAINAVHLSRYSPYAAAIIGPLPGFEPVAPAPAVEPEAAPVEPARPETVPVEAEPQAPVPSTTGAPDLTPVIPLVSPAPAISPFPPMDQPLVLTPLTEADMVQADRPAWPEEARAAPAAVEETALFEDEPTLSVLRHEVEPTQPRRFDWSETGAFLIMGGVGLAACGASAAAFRLAVEQPSPMGETSVIAWALALIGVICVGVSSWNLYVRWGKPD